MQCALDPGFFGTNVVAVLSLLSKNLGLPICDGAREGCGRRLQQVGTGAGSGWGETRILLVVALYFRFVFFYLCLL